MHLQTRPDTAWRLTKRVQALGRVQAFQVVCEPDVRRLGLRIRMTRFVCAWLVEPDVE